MTKSTILIAGGGTGGHVFPAVAVAEALQRAADVEVVFCGTARGVEARVVPARGWKLEILDVEPLKGGGVALAARGSLVAARATARAFGLVKRLHPQAVLSVGGYASGPVSLASALRGVPLAVLEPNSIVGLANRILAPFARRAYVAWDGAAAHFKPAACRRFGVPLREGFFRVPYEGRGTARLLVMGGSQGAAPLNERVPAAAALAARTLPGLEVLHQAGRDRDAPVRERYASLGMTSVTVVPFIDDVAGAIAAADIVVARAGAATVAELTAIGRAAILIPFPLAADDHQARNADALAGAGGALSMRQEAATPEALAGALLGLMVDEAARKRMADNSGALGRPSAAHDVAVDLLALSGTALREAA